MSHKANGEGKEKKKRERSKREIEILGEVSRKPSVIFYMDS